MIGASMPYRRLCGETSQPFKDVNAFLEKLKESGVSSIELRAVSADRKPEEVFSVVRNIWKKGLTVTVHGGVKTEETAVSDIFMPLKEVLSNLQQKELVITIHPTKYDNVSILTRLSDYIKGNNLPVKIALENNRFMPDGQRGDCIGFVTDIVNDVKRENVGICFDMGHYYYNCLLDYPEKPKTVPSESFLNKVIHTHIHALSREKSTHFPFNQDNTLPLAEYLNALAHNYFGVYNIEIEYERFSELYPAEDAWLQSVEAVKNAMPFCGRFYDDIRKNFVPGLKKSAEVLTDNEDAFSLFHSSSYIFNTNSVKWAVDPGFRNAGILTDCIKELPKLFKEVELILITHEHIDHFEPQTVAVLKDMGIKWIIPSFLTNTALRYGINRENIITAEIGKTVAFKDMEILPFEGKHFRKTNGVGIESFAYYVTGKNMPSMMFLGDVRDYEIGNITVDGKIDYLFSHVWLGDNVAGNDSLVGDIPQMFVDYVTSFNAQNIVLAHLYESGRSKNNMWKLCHGKALSELIKRKCPEVKVFIPLTGDKIKL